MDARSWTGGVPRRAVEESEGKPVSAGLWETRVVEPSRGERVSGMSNIRGRIISLNQNVVSISTQANGWVVVDVRHIEIDSCAPSPSVSLPWSRSMRWELDR